MDLLIATEARYKRTPDGRVWTDGIYDRNFWAQYLTVFEGVTVVARVHAVQEVPPHLSPVTSSKISVASVPYYVGPVQYIRRFQEVRRAVAESLSHGEALILRAPGRIASLLAREAHRRHRPFAIELIGDPADVFYGHGIHNPLRRIFSAISLRDVKFQTAHAIAGSYVTERKLQARYPLSSGAYTTHYSAVDIGPEDFVASSVIRTSEPLRLVMVGSLAQMYKGPDVLIRAVALCSQRGLDVQVAIVGEGKYRPSMESLAKELHIASKVSFHGQLPPGSPVQEVLDSSDIFVLPSRTEGLPSALIEAMARGLPCIGSRVGGMIELLPDEALVPPDDIEALASKIAHFCADVSLRKKMGQRNLHKAMEYQQDVLRERRDGFYSHVKEVTQQWNNR